MNKNGNKFIELVNTEWSKFTKEAGYVGGFSRERLLEVKIRCGIEFRKFEPIGTAEEDQIVLAVARQRFMKSKEVEAFLLGYPNLLDKIKTFLGIKLYHFFIYKKRLMEWWFKYRLGQTLHTTSEDDGEIVDDIGPRPHFKTGLEALQHQIKKGKNLS